MGSSPPRYMHPDGLWYRPHSPHSDGVPFAGDSLERSYLFYDRPSRLSSNAPACRGQSRLSGFCCAHRLCVRSPCQHISRMRTFDNNSCAISITSPRSLFRPRTQHGRWGHREKSRRASTRWDCRGKSCLAGLSPLSGTLSERRVYGSILVCSGAQGSGRVQYGYMYGTLEKRLSETFR